MNTIINLCDNSNPNWSKTIKLNLDDKLLTTLKDYNNDEYDEAWDELIRLVEKTYPDLPEDWFFNKVVFEGGEI